MKKILLAILICSASILAKAELVTAISQNGAVSASVIAEMVTHVGFAPPEHRGTFKFQILADGVVQNVDNKDQTSVLAKFTKSKLTNIKNRIELIRKNKLVGPPEAHGCMDAPSQSILVYQAKGTESVIWQRRNCLEYFSTNAAAKSLAQIILKLDLDLNK